MPNIVLDIKLTDETINRIADAVMEARAKRTLADAGMLPPDAAPEPPVTDPWDADDAPQPERPSGGSAAVTAPYRSRPAAPSSDQPQTITVSTGKGPQQWTLGAANAPLCSHNQPAAYIQGFTNGKSWKRWACALGAGEQWRNKCQFSEWA